MFLQDTLLKHRVNIQQAMSKCSRSV